MRVAKELIKKSVISIEEGKELGEVEDFFVDQDFTRMTAIYLGSEGFFGGKEMVIKWSNVVNLGQDAILTKNADCIDELSEIDDPDNYVRRSDILGRRIDTPGGTRIGKIGDVIVDDEGVIIGFSLSLTYVTGPIASNKAIGRTAVVDTHGAGGTLTADLAEAEEANLKVVYEGFFAEPGVELANPEKALASE